ncbi:TIGR02757 family protein [Ginsengibacter hankyongi]|uniref:TIGR02757 family protein n=1 Tax=Ginsengibacter hankyongi TaxID=2607284 RepID=A0A5J5IMU9_9BACT|nr:TIGR02757 family protein [Ginsengibacter hankyongi]KAA9041653.1 TIGR02757 family protein [Ginsengibacter hankyongi]
MEKENIARDLKKFLDQKVIQFNNPSFIKDDPVCIPHLFSKKQDIEIAGFFAATFAWGIRKTIINKSKLLLQLMDNAPYDFCLHHNDEDLKKVERFCHRTFNDTDLLYFISFFKFHYSKHNSLEVAFFNNKTIKQFDNVVEHSLNYFNQYFFSLEDVPARTKKHIASPQKNSTCKRLNMYLRWMVRNDDKGVDFGIWKKISPSQLICPVDLHVARVAKHFNLLKRKQVDWRAAIELTEALKKFDVQDPVKYDFALFSLGALGKY